MKSRKKQVMTGFEGLVGQIGRVSERIEREGMVYVAGALWKAVADEIIEKDEPVTILSGHNQILKVAKVTIPREG